MGYKAAMDILAYLRGRLKEIGPAGWPAVVDAANARLTGEHDPKVTVHSLRKIAYGDRDNPGLKQVQALLDHLGHPRPSAAEPQREAA